MPMEEPLVRQFFSVSTEYQGRTTLQHLSHENQDSKSVFICRGAGAREYFEGMMWKFSWSNWHFRHTKTSDRIHWMALVSENVALFCVCVFWKRRPKENSMQIETNIEVVGDMLSSYIQSAIIHIFRSFHRFHFFSSTLVVTGLLVPNCRTTDAVSVTETIQPAGRLKENILNSLN